MMHLCPCQSNLVSFCCWRPPPVLDIAFSQHFNSSLAFDRLRIFLQNYSNLSPHFVFSFPTSKTLPLDSRHGYSALCGRNLKKHLGVSEIPNLSLTNSGNKWEIVLLRAASQLDEAKSGLDFLLSWNQTSNDQPRFGCAMLLVSTLRGSEIVLKHIWMVAFNYSIFKMSQQSQQTIQPRSWGISFRLYFFTEPRRWDFLWIILYRLTYL